jgi:DMSO/TMAO reductase YedYZ molybdopterin-dependent catalytic subunit
MTGSSADAPPRGTDTSAGAAALAGVLGVAMALGVSELLAALLPGGRSLVVAVGDAVIDSVPGWLERAAIAALGTADKPVLLAGILVVSALLGALLGRAAVRRFPLAVAGFAAAAAVGALAALSDPRGSATVAVGTALVAAAAGLGTLWLLLRAARAPAPVRGTAEDATGTPDQGSERVEPMRRPGGPVGRRGFLALAGLVTVVASAAAVGGRMLAADDRVRRVRAAIRLPRPARPAGPVPPEADLEIAGLTPLFIPNEDFFRIDTALVIPQVDVERWSLQVTGLVDRPFSLTYAELMELPQVEADITLTCVSNEVGGELVGNARWQGVPLRLLLERAGLQEGSTQLVGRSVDGFTAGFPTVTALDVGEAMVAVGMNGEPLPAVHGFPARLVVPGLYGYVSATKWLSSIELTGWDDVDGYWIPRGWAKEGPIKTQSRIDVPAPGSRVPAGRRPIAGVAWAPTRGIERVEVRVDDGPWQEAELAAPLDIDCWRQWFLPWEATPGQHVLAVRATDGAGEVQTDERTPVAPDGAAGRHTIRVVVVDA